MLCILDPRTLTGVSRDKEKTDTLTYAQKSQGLGDPAHSWSGANSSIRLEPQRVSHVQDTGRDETVLAGGLCRWEVSGRKHPGRGSCSWSLAHTANIPTQGFASSEPVPHGEGLASPPCVLGIGSRHGRAHVNHTCPLGTSSDLYTSTPGFLSCQHLNGRQNELRLWTENRSWRDLPFLSVSDWAD